MSRTVGVVYDAEADLWDLGGGIPEGLEALRQRLLQAIWLAAGEWFLRVNRGLDRSLVIGHQVRLGIARSALDEVIRIEGGSEVTGLRNSRISLTGRTANYSVTVDTIWGEINMSETLGG